MIPDASRRDRMVAMYQRGLGTEEIAEQFSVRTPAVRSALIRAGVYRHPATAK
jgi:DNA-directed RNA polymerase specialized sigma24 family protein